MAISAANTLANFSGFINPEQSAPIFERAARSSVAMQLSRQVPLGANGKSIPVVTGRPSAAWISEATTKHATSGAMTLASITPKKLTAIMVDSMEVVRANPGQYVTTMRNAMAEAFAIAFDRAVFHDEGGDGSAGGGPFATYLDQTTKTVELGTNAAAAGSVHADFVEVLRQVVTDTDASGRRYRLSGWALDDVVEPALWGALDTTGRPIYTELPTDQTNGVLATPGRLLNRASFMGEGVASANDYSVVGYGGDWSQTAWGVVGGISYRTSTEAAVTINSTLTWLFEHNLVAMLGEAEYGFLLNDPDAFVKLTNNSGS